PDKGGREKTPRASQLPQLLEQLQAKADELQSKIREGQLKADATANEQSYNLLKDALEREKKLLDQNLEDRFISISDYYDRVALRQEEAIQAEITRERQKQVEEQAQLDEKRRQIDDELKRKQAEIDKAKVPAKEKDVQKESEGKINLLLQQRKQFLEDNERAGEKAHNDLLTEIANFNSEVSALRGHTSEAAIAAINERLQPLLEKIIQEEGPDSSLAQLLREFIDFMSDRARIDELLGRADRIRNEFDVRSAEVQASTAQNVVAAARARRELNQLLQEYADKQLEVLNRALEIAQAEGDQEKVLEVRKRIAEIRQMKNEYQSFGQELKNTAINSGVDALISNLHDVETGAKTAGQALRDMALSALDAIEQLILRMLILKLLEKTLGGIFGGSNDGFFGMKNVIFSLDNQFGDGHAAGGLITGPGTETSDSIFARLSRGEYVIRAASVKNLGLNVLNHLNSFGRLPAFAMGGFADIPVGGSGDSARGGDSFNFNFKEREHGRSRIPSRAAFRDTVRMIKGATTFGQ
ncbi:MAG: hypothetical protein M3362_17005, partial [Acidobacteriota bacterium]|nr:hypothetical protein [Acidobacteriota bacterium]